MAKKVTAKKATKKSLKKNERVERQVEAVAAGQQIYAREENIDDVIHKAAANAVRESLEALMTSTDSTKGFTARGLAERLAAVGTQLTGAANAALRDITAQEDANNVSENDLDLDEAAAKLRNIVLDASDDHDGSIVHWLADLIVMLDNNDVKDQAQERIRENTLGDFFDDLYNHDGILLTYADQEALDRPLDFEYHFGDRFPKRASMQAFIETRVLENLKNLPDFNPDLLDYAGRHATIPQTVEVIMLYQGAVNNANSRIEDLLERLTAKGKKPKIKSIRVSAR